VKSYIGHSLASAAGDQMMSTLGAWKYGLIPGIRTIDALADDVHTENLDILLQHKQVSPTSIDATIINSKGFGGNNASASILSPHIVENMLKQKHGSDSITKYRHAQEQVIENTQAYDEAAIAGEANTIYRFGENVLGADAVDLDLKRLKIKGVKNVVELDVPNNYTEFCG